MDGHSFDFTVGFQGFSVLSMIMLTYMVPEPTLINIALNNTVPAELTSATWDAFCENVSVRGEL